MDKSLPAPPGPSHPPRLATFPPKALECPATEGSGLWAARCKLVKGHDSFHQDWRGYGSVLYRRWLDRHP
jgi:hypothetical protein